MTVDIMRKNNKYNSGLPPPLPKSDLDEKISNLNDKNIPELLELRDRQLKLLKNKPFISRLADRGAKIQTLYDKIVAVLTEKQNEEQACSLFRDMKLNTVAKEAVQDVEWRGEITNKNDTYLDSDDDSDPEDVIKILSQSTAQEKKIKVLSPEKPSISPNDLLSIGEMPHIRYIVDKTENVPVTKVSGNFKPYKTTKSDVHNPDKEIHRKKHKNWEVTAATPPPIVHGPAKLLPLEESLKLQKDYNIHLREVEAQHAAQKLLERTGIKMPSLPHDTSKFGVYRDVESDDSDKSDAEASDQEVHDEEPERGGVVFTVMK